MALRKMNSKTGVSRTILIAMMIIGLAFITTAANASCFDHGRASSPSLPKGLIAKLAASPNAAHGTIVGLWQVSYTTSDNQPFQDSFDMWHSDNTELEIANVDPVIGNSCIGVWKQVGSEIHLHHVGWGFDNLGNLIGPFTVDDVLTLANHGNSYSGSFDFKQYDNEGNLLQEVTGTITATRIGVS
jgi:hypothetical protein